jgi:hypothetical protein
MSNLSHLQYNWQIFRQLFKSQDFLSLFRSVIFSFGFLFFSSPVVPRKESSLSRKQPKNNQLFWRKYKLSLLLFNHLTVKYFFLCGFLLINCIKTYCNLKKNLKFLNNLFFSFYWHKCKKVIFHHCVQSCFLFSS